MSSLENYTVYRTNQGEFIVDKRYVNLRLIGDGCSGMVCSADDTLTSTKVAIKKVSNIFRDIGEAKRILREMKLLRHFSLHENIVTINDLMTYPEGAVDFRDVYIVTSLMESTMHNVISSGQPLSGRHHQYFIYQVLRGLKYIHSASVLHRDLKPSNLLVDANCDLSICDFGLARGVELGGENSLSEYVVTRWYRAPELLCNSSYYGKEVDIWSVGCIFAEMLGRKPFLQGKNPIHQLKCIMSKLGVPSKDDLLFFQSCPARDTVMALVRAQKKSPIAPPLASYFPLDTDPQAIDLLSKMLQFNPSKRISVGEALAHPYLHVLHNEMLEAEPECEEIFDCEFEKKYFGPKQRNIPLHELHIMMFREMLSYRPSEIGELHLNAYIAQTNQSLVSSAPNQQILGGALGFNADHAFSTLSDGSCGGDMRYQSFLQEGSDIDFGALFTFSASNSECASDMAISPGMFAAL